MDGRRSIRIGGLAVPPSGGDDDGNGDELRALIPTLLLAKMRPGTAVPPGGTLFIGRLSQPARPPPHGLGDTR